MAKHFYIKTLGRALDPRANGAWLSKLTHYNMKCLSWEDRELIRRARRDDREARRNEEREKREDRKRQNDNLKRRRAPFHIIF